MHLNISKRVSSISPLLKFVTLWIKQTETWECKIMAEPNSIHKTGMHSHLFKKLNVLCLEASRNTRQNEIFHHVHAWNFCCYLSHFECQNLGVSPILSIFILFSILPFMFLALCKPYIAFLQPISYLLHLWFCYKKRMKVAGIKPDQLKFTSSLL